MGNVAPEPCCCQENQDGQPIEVVQSDPSKGPENQTLEFDTLEKEKVAEEAPAVKIELLDVPSRSTLGRGETNSSVPSGASKLSKLQRLQSLGCIKVDKDMLCGLTIRKSLRSLGRTWMKMPQEMSQEQLVALHGKAVPMESFDFFLSHTWSTPGKWKVLSLTLQTGWMWGLIFSNAGGALGILLCMYEVLPMPWSFSVRTLAGDADFPLGCWVSLGSFLGMVFGLLLSPYLPCLNGREGNCFIDMVSIDQSDPVKTEDGIYGIGGFLSVSKELQVLWSPPYLSRLWCVFELAAYRKANPRGKITLSPLYVEQVLVMIICGLFVVLGTYWVTVVLALDSFVSSLVYLICTIPAIVPLHHMRRSFMASKHKLLTDLEAFDIYKVECMNDFDREFIHAAVIKWYGSREKFTEFVRGPLRDELLQGTYGNYFPVGYFLLASAVPAWMAMEFFLSYLKAAASGDWLLSYALGSVLGFDVLWTWLALRIILLLCDRLASRWSRGDFLKTLFIWLCLATWQSSGAILQGMAIRSSIWTSTGWLGFTIVLFGLSWRVPC